MIKNVPKKTELQKSFKTDKCALLQIMGKHWSLHFASDSMIPWDSKVTFDRKSV